MNTDKKYMHRALQLARCGEGLVSPNPMVGAVVVARGRIIGEGFHARYGGPHAEVNAIESVAKPDRELLKESTIYVTLEPCSHFGKTPPCASLIIKTGIPRVVIGSPDPNPLVAGRGIRMLEEAGCEVVKFILEKECMELNCRFMTAHSSPRPWILLKWAQSADGFMAAIDDDNKPKPIKFSNPVSSVWMHRERGNVDAILVGSNTLRIDKPRLDNRLWGGPSPRKITLQKNEDLNSLVERLRHDGVTSLMVEGGPTILKSFINQQLYDEIRIETSPVKLHHGLPSPVLPDDLKLADLKLVRGNIISTFRR